MLKSIFWPFVALLMTLSLSSCLSQGEESAEQINRRSPVLAPIKLSASRDYNPSRWQHGVISVSRPGLFAVPSELQLVAGHVGTGWASINVAGRKFCYQGNALHNNDSHGSAFLLRFEKLSPQDQCHDATTNIPYNRQVMLSSNQLITLQVHGGGCGSSCGFIEIEMQMNPR